MEWLMRELAEDGGLDLDARDGVPGTGKYDSASQSCDAAGKVVGEGQDKKPRVKRKDSTGGGGTEEWH